MNTQYLIDEKKRQQITLQEIDEKSGIPKRTVDDIFSGHTVNPRIDTLLAIEKALGIAPQWTKDEMQKGVSPAVILTEKYRLTLLADADNVLGEDYVDTYLSLLAQTIQQKKTK